MTSPARITGPFLDIVEVFVSELLGDGRELHGWSIMKQTRRSGPTVYGVLDRLEDMGWIAGRWEEDAEPGKPRRRYYRLTPVGQRKARQLLAERRPAALQTRPGTVLPRPREAGAR